MKESEEKITRAEMITHILSFDSYGKFDFDKAILHLTNIRSQYKKTGASQIIKIELAIKPLMIRFVDGERTENLLNEIMAVK